MSHNFISTCSPTRRTIILTFTIMFFLLIHSIHSFAMDCTHPIYCEGPILNAVQKSRIFNDSKTFVDMPMRYEADEIIEKFHRETRSLARFLADNFYAAGSDVLPHTPADFRDNPPFIHQIRDYNLRRFAHAIHRIWKDLVREHRPIGKDSTFLPLPFPFVVPGGRFREFYYWDTYWIVDGLLVSGLIHTAKNVIRNLLYMVQKFGFVPNGARLYFLNRSQPPMLTQMVLCYFEKTNDMEFLKEALPVLDKEYTFWMLHRNVTLEARQTEQSLAEEFTLNVYSAETNRPRPESYIEDIETAEHLPEKEKKILYHQIASACETGWDFSSRWFADQTHMTTLITSKIVPVDLNAILYKNERNLATLHALIGNSDKEQYYTKQADRRRIAFDTFLYDSDEGIWKDWNLNEQKQEQSIYASAYIPLWANLHDEEKSTAQMLTHMKQHGLLEFIGGVPTTLRRIHQQWDFPNAWAPLQWFIVKGLQNIGAHNEALELAKKWVTSNYCGWVVKNAMFEKYNATRLGAPGGGGEYVVQEGFGWTNGVLLSLLTEYGDQLKTDERVCFPSYRRYFSIVVVSLFVVFVILTIGLIILKDRLVRYSEKDAIKPTESKEMENTSNHHHTNMEDADSSSTSVKNYHEPYVWERIFYALFPDEYNSDCTQK